MGKKIILRSLLVGCLTTLYACSDNSGTNSTSPEAQPPANTTITLLGSASKGIISGATVAIYPINESVIAQTAALTGNTDEHGRFMLEGEDPQAELLLVRITGNENGVTRMQCDLVDCGESTLESIDENSNGRIDSGEWQTLTPEFELEAIVSDYRGQGSISVNLATHIVAKQMQADTLSTRALLERNQYWQDLLGLTNSFITATPVNLSSEFQIDIAADQLLIASLMQFSPRQSSNIHQKLKDLNELIINSELTALVEQKPTAFTSYAITVASSLNSSSATSLKGILMQKNQVIADAEQLLEYADLPKLPPVL